MKILKIKFYKRPTLESGSVSCNVDKFTIEELEDAKRLVEIGIAAKQSKKKKAQKTICSVCKTPNTDGTFYCQTCGNEIK